ncbi:hypothetical protein Tco_0986079 [Tanacetum coccineum]
MIPRKGDLRDYWRDISTDGDFLGPLPSYTLIRDLVIRLCHRMMAHSIAGRSQAPEKVTVTDLFYLRGLDVGSVNIPYLLARYLRRFAAGRKSGALISCGQFVARLAKHFGLLTKERLHGLIPLSLSFDFVFLSEIFKSLSFCLDRLCHLAILCLDQHAHTLHHLESLLTISLDRLDIFEGRSCISEFVRKSLSLILELS